MSQNTKKGNCTFSSTLRLNYLQILKWEHFLHFSCRKSVIPGDLVGRHILIAKCFAECGVYPFQRHRKEIAAKIFSQTIFCIITRQNHITEEFSERKCISLEESNNLELDYFIKYKMMMMMIFERSCILVWTLLTMQFMCQSFGIVEWNALKLTSCGRPANLEIESAWKLKLICYRNVVQGQIQWQIQSQIQSQIQLQRQWKMRK